MSTTTTIARITATTLVVLGLSSGIAVANPCETDPAFAAANDCAIPATQVLSASVSAAPSTAATMAPGLGLLVR